MDLSADVLTVANSDDAAAATGADSATAGAAAAAGSAGAGAPVTAQFFFSVDLSADVLTVANSDDAAAATGADSATAGAACRDRLGGRRRRTCHRPVLLERGLKRRRLRGSSSERRTSRGSPKTASASELIGAASCVAASVEYEGSEYEASTFSRSAPEGGDQRLIVDALPGAGVGDAAHVCDGEGRRELDAHSATSRGILAVSER